ncbi:AAA family ATPase [Dankookia sp. GCM10030260]|uniref:AAA family ATPase n=1 Tax=Dankookia sp. GCM10030260 TaxID=3273390 RepID=UPI00361E4BE6
MTDVGTWLRGLGLGQYEAAFRDNDVGSDLLPGLTAEDLKELGVASLGHRKRLLAAIAALRPGAVAPQPGLGDTRTPPVAPAEAVGAERRQLAVLFCDLAGSTALSARLDPEDMRAVVNAYHAAVGDAVRRRDGYVAKLLGDGVLAYFGWPHAHEDDAERAVRAGLAAVDAVARLCAPGGGPLAARAGLATGEVVVGEVLGEGEARERGVVGETPNLAARLQAVAEPGAVVADAATRRLTGALFAWEDMGEAEVKGLLRPVRAWRALGESGVESRFEALRSDAAAPMVGREEELELLLRRWRRVRAGEGQVVLLRGEPGIGKSRLTAALLEAIAEEHEEMVFQCSPQHTDSALRPVVARLEHAADLAPSDAPVARLAKLEAWLLPLDPPPGDVALVADLLSVPTLGRWPSLGDLSPQARRTRLLVALLRRVRALAARAPVLLVVEDAHWADPTTRELLDLFVAEAPVLPLLLVVTHRPEFDPSAWLGQPHVTPVQLNRLRRAEHSALLRRVAGGKALPPEVEAEVLARSDGVPLFVEEVGRAVLESGLLREEAERWALDGPLPRLAVPASLQASLVARLDRLPSAREAAQAGAVIGREFAHDLLAAVAGVPAPALRSALDALVAADLFQRCGTPPEALYAFRHALIRDAAESTLLRERRRELHRRAAEAIERLRPEAVEREPELLARHRAEAGEAEAAAALYLRAAERAAARSALREARAHLARGLALLPGVADADAAQRLEVGLLTVRGNVANADAGLGSAESGRAFGRAVALCRASGEEGAPLARALCGLWTHRLHAGDFAEAARLAEAAVRAARRGGGPGLRRSALAALGSTRCLMGEHAAAAPPLREVLADPDAFEVGPWTGSASAGSLAQVFLCRVLLATSALDRSAAHAAEVLARTAGRGHLASRATALAGCCAHAWIAGDAALLRERTRTLAALAAAEGFPHWAVRARAYEGWAAAAEGRAAEGVGLMEESLAAQRAAGTTLLLPLFEAMLSDAHLLAGDAAAALSHAEEGLAIAARTGEAWFDAELRRRLSCVLLRLDPGDAGRAEAEFRRAIEIARSQGARLFELRAARDLARLLRDLGGAAAARDLLAPVYASFTEGFGFPDLVEARALLRELGAAPRRGEAPAR